MRLSLILFLSAVCNLASIAAQNAAAERLTIENGLSQGMIFDICQTRDGFLWMSTKDGLNRYDGHNFKVFSNNPFDPFTLAENTVTALYEDSRGWLWVGTETKGLDLFDTQTGRVHHFPLNFKEDYLVERVAVVKIRESADGTIWVRKGGVGLIRIPIPKAWESGLPDTPDLSDAPGIMPFPICSGQQETDRMIDFELRSNGDLVVSTTQKQFSLNVEQGTCQPMNVDKLPNNLGQVALSRRKGTEVCWFLNNSSVCRLSNGVLRTFETPDVFSGSRRIIWNDDLGHAWLVLKERVWNLDALEEINFSTPDFDIPEQATAFKHDRNGNLWIGTLGYGLYKIYPAKKSFHAGATGTSIAGVWRDVKGRYYCKTYFSVIVAYDPLTGKLDKKTAFPDAGINQESLAFDASGNTWLLCSKDILTEQATLRRYNPDGQFEQEYPLDTKLSHREQLYFSRDGTLWIALGGCRLIRFNPANKVLESFDFTHLFGDKIATVRITSLLEDSHGILWLGTQFGLVKCTPRQQSYHFELIQADPAKPNGLNNNSIACLLADPNNAGNILWIGTKGGGINRFDIQKNTYQHLTTADGLPNNVVYGILSDSKNDLWCSTNRGLAKIAPRSNQTPITFDITAFTVKMGLQDNEFNTFSFFKASNGEMLFGGVNGLNRFFPDELLQDTTAPTVYIVGFEINHLPAEKQLPVPVELLQNLALRFDQNNLSFEFAALDFTDPGKNRYRYRLVGLDENWVETGGGRFAHFSHLAPGAYELRVEGSNGESAWRAAKPVFIVIHPPWWRSGLAYLLYFLLLAYLGWKVYQFQIRRVKMQEALAYGAREAERVRLLEQMKTNFFSNVTHEFRSPLTLIIEPLRQLLKTPASEAWRSQVQLAVGNSQQLLGLVNQLLDMAKLESGSLSVDLRHGDLLQTIRAVIETLLPLAAKLGVKLSMTQTSHVASFTFDPGKVEFVLNNLISNALKFTPSGGTVVVQLKETSGQPPFAVMEVRDTGIGVPEVALDRLFDRFFQVDASAGGGKGIGLSLSKELAQLMGGNISVESTVGKGSTFVFSVPMTQMTQPPQRQESGVTAAKDVRNEFDNLEETNSQPVILIIEDNAELRGFLKESIQHRYQVVEASDGEEGLRKALALLPDLVVSDVMMPQKDGYEVCEALKTNMLTAHIPIILLTAKTGIDSKIAGLRTGADDYFSKPFNTDELMARMDNLLQSRRKVLAAANAADVDNGTQEMQTPSDREFLRKFRLTLEQHLSDEALSVEDVAHKMSISRMQLHRKLKALSDQSATEYIRNYRLDRAMALLKNKEGNVKKVAAMVGFADEKYFSKTFKEHFGISPSEV
jgi:signal transduction histidine kinase/DNA-binding response OmpR family regulator/ligand-binding sensor domain-containing protein